MKITINNLNTLFAKYGILFLFVVFIIIEAYGKYFNFIKDSTQIPMFIKAILLTTAVVYIIVFTKKKPPFWMLLGLIVVFLIGQLTIYPSFSENSLKIVIKFFSPLIFFLLFNTVGLSKDFQKQTFAVFEWVMVANSVLIVLGVLSGFYFFQSYLGSRFGYSGVFQAAGVTSYVYLITMFYFVISDKKEVYKNWKFLIIYITCFFVGTKSLYLGLIVISAYIFYLQNFKYKKIVLIGVSLLVTVIAYFFFFKYGLFNRIRESKGILSAVLSYRDLLFINNTKPYILENWTWINYLFGGTSNYDLRSQMEIIDLFFFWGIFGGLLYLVTFIKTYITFQLNNLFWVFATLLTIVVLLAGNFFVYSTITVFLLIIREKFRSQQKDLS